MSWTIQNEFVPGTVAMACYVCKCDLRPESPTGQEGHEKALDTGIMIDFEGYVALCESCVIEAGNLIGLTEPAKVRDLEEQILDLAATLATTAEERDNALTAVDALRRLPALTGTVEAIVPATGGNDGEALTDPPKRGPGRPKTKTV